MNPETPSTTSVVDPDPIAPATKVRHSASAPKDELSRCQHRFANGKRCRLPGIASQFGFCFRHFTLNAAIGASRLQPPSDFEDLSADLLPQRSEFDAALSINQFLSRLLVLVTKGRVTPRRAAVLAYITNQLLHSHRAIQRDQILKGDHNQHDGPTVIWDVTDDTDDLPDHDRGRQSETIRVDLGDLLRPDRSQPCPSPNSGNGAPK
jgi:hypothetical protein